MRTMKWLIALSMLFAASVQAQTWVYDNTVHYRENWEDAPWEIPAGETQAYPDGVGHQVLATSGTGVGDFEPVLTKDITLGDFTYYKSNSDLFGAGFSVIWDNAGTGAVLDVNSRFRSRFETDWVLVDDLHFTKFVRADPRPENWVSGVISGDGSLTIEILNTQQPDDYENVPANNDRGYFLQITGTAPNTYTGGTVVVGNDGDSTSPIRAQKTGSFGSGDVMMTGSAQLMIEADDVINPGAILDLSAEALVFVRTGITQSGIAVYHDGEMVPEGTYTGGDFEWLTGGGTLIVVAPVIAGVEVPMSAGFVRVAMKADEWKLVGLPFNQVADDMVALADVLGTIGFANGTEVMAWDGTGYVASSFFLGTWSGNVEMRRGQGFWIKSPVDMDLFLLGQVPGEEDTAINLYQGLQLVSAPYPAAIDLNDEDILLSVPFNGDQIFFIGDGPGYTSNAYFMGTWSGAGILEPGKGYWYNSVDDQEMLVGKPY